MIGFAAEINYLYRLRWTGNTAEKRNKMWWDEGSPVRVRRY